MLGLQVLLGGIKDELSEVKKAAIIDHQNFIRMLYILNARVSEIREIVTKCCGENNERGGFVKEMKGFVEECEEELKVVKDEHLRIMELVKKTNEYYLGGGGGSNPFELEADTSGQKLASVVELAANWQIRVEGELRFGSSCKTALDSGCSINPLPFNSFGIYNKKISVFSSNLPRARTQTGAEAQNTPPRANPCRRVVPPVSTSCITLPLAGGLGTSILGLSYLKKEVNQLDLPNARLQCMDQWLPVYSWLETLDKDDVVKSKDIFEWLIENPKILKRKKKKKGIEKLEKDTLLMVHKDVAMKHASPVPSSSINNLSKDSDLYMAKRNETYQKYDI
ncbi:hypothetical protein HN873_066842 [Arachis hypogaea]